MMYSNKIHYDDDGVHRVVSWMADFVLCIPGYQTLVTKIVQKSLRVCEGLNSTKKLFKDRIQVNTELRNKQKNQLKKQTKAKGEVSRSRKNPSDYFNPLQIRKDWMLAVSVMCSD